MESLTERVDTWIADAAEEVVAWRRHLHQHPEPSFEEQATAQFVYDRLLSFGGFELSRPTPTSVLAVLKGGSPGLTLALRADMDALRIQEENTFEFASTNPGVMHACGHDGHTAMLLGAAKVLTRLRDDIHGELRFFFQHAEEVHPGGAQALVDAGVMEGVDAVIGIHLRSGTPVGQLAVSAGPINAASDRFDITVIGKGGHAAHPYSTVDSLAVAAQVVTNLQHVVSRYADPLDPIVLSVTKIQGGSAHNVIPGSIELGGTVRTYNPALRDQVPVWMERVIRGITAAHGADYQFDYRKGYRPLINDAALAEGVRQALVKAFGEARVGASKPGMGGEDFSAYGQKAPITFFHLGAGNVDKGIVYPHHHPKFTIDEDALPVGVKAFVHCTLDLLDGAWKRQG